MLFSSSSVYSTQFFRRHFALIYAYIRHFAYIISASHFSSVKMSYHIASNRSTAGQYDIVIDVNSKVLEVWRRVYTLLTVKNLRISSKNYELKTGSGPFLSHYDGSSNLFRVKNLQFYFKIAIDLDNFIHRCFSIVLMDCDSTSLTINNFYFNITCDSINLANFCLYILINFYMTRLYLQVGLCVYQQFNMMSVYGVSWTRNMLL